MKQVSSTVLFLALVCAACAPKGGVEPKDEDEARATVSAVASEEPMQVQYLEIVTPDVEAVCSTYARVYGVTFSAPVAELGNARTADLPNGGKLGVRAPMRDTEAPVVRPYLLVDDIAAAVEAAESAGATIAHPPMELPGQGTFAIFTQAGIEHGLWQK